VANATSFVFWASDQADIAVRAAHIVIAILPLVAAVWAHSCCTGGIGIAGAEKGACIYG
jgi:hypothetical protein